jgi:serine/threonine-protein kinase
VRDVALVIGIAALGYLISAVWISPTPLLGTTDHAIPRLLGRAEAQAREALAAVGFRARVTGTRSHPTARAGTVVWQDPPPDVVLSPNATVALVLSAGPAPVPVPDVVGLDTATARRILTASGVSVGREEAGIVVATRPAIGVSRPRGAPVGLVVSRGFEESP